MDQYTSVSGQAQSYDLNGNLTSDGTRSFVFSSQNQLLSATTSAGASTYAYGPANRRVRKETPDGTVTDFVMTGEMVIAEYDGNGQLLRRYIPGAGVDQRIMVVHCNGSATGRPPAPATHSQYYLPDRQGHVLATISETGGVVQKFHYTPFGVEMVGDPTGNPFRYTGRYYDAETGLYYYRARYYDADLGRFLSVDPIGYADQWNLYAYVGNSPLMYTDPSGMCTLGSDAVSAANPGCRITGWSGSWSDPRHNGEVQQLSSSAGLIRHSLIGGGAPAQFDISRHPAAISGAEARIMRSAAGGDASSFARAISAAATAGEAQRIDTTTQRSAASRPALAKPHLPCKALSQFKAMNGDLMERLPAPVSSSTLNRDRLAIAQQVLRLQPEPAMPSTRLNIPFNMLAASKLRRRVKSR